MDKTIVFKLFFLLIVVLLIWFINKKYSKNPICPNNSDKVIFSFFGAPGSGKGTLAQQCISELGYKSLSTGAMFRENMAKQTELGKLAQTYINDGNLVPDQVTMDMVKEWLKENINSKPIILDGVPRTREQAKMLNEIFKNNFPEYQFRIIRLVLPKEEIVDRLVNRVMCENKECQAIYNTSMPEAQSGICPKCGGKLVKREDDKKEIIEKRFDVYQKNENEILDFYKDSNQKIEEINISKLNPKQVFEKFKNIA